MRRLVRRGGWPIATVLLVLVLSSILWWWFRRSMLPDTIDLIGPDQAAVLLSGRTATGCAQDVVHAGASELYVNNMLAPTRACPTDLIVFATDHPLQWIRWTPAGSTTSESRWTSGKDYIKVPHEAPRPSLRVSVWIVKDGAVSREDVAKQLGRADQLFNTMGCGIKLTITYEPEIDPPAQARGYTGSEACDRLKQLYDAHHKEDAINVYAGAGLPDYGTSCPTLLRKAMAINWKTSLETAAHEFGHLFELEHKEVPTEHNVMSGGTSGRNFLTYGQCFKANAHTDSALRLLEVTSSLPPVTCRNGDCPNLQCAGCARGAQPPAMTLEQAVDFCVEGDCRAAELAIIKRPENIQKAIELIKGRASGLTDPERQRLLRHYQFALRELNLYAFRHEQTEWMTADDKINQFADDYVAKLHLRIKINVSVILNLYQTQQALQALQSLDALGRDPNEEVRAAYEAALQSARSR